MFLNNLCKKSSAPASALVALALVLGAASCIIPGGVTDPGSNGALDAIAGVDRDVVTTGGSIVLSGAGSGGTPPYVFRWDQNGGPADVAVEPPTDAEITVGPLTTSGRYTFRLVVTDQAGRTDEAFVSVTVEGDLPDAPRVLVETNFGDFAIELDAVAAPLHTENLLGYTDEGFFDGLLFHRNACTEDADTGDCIPFVLQGGGFERIDGMLEPRIPTRAPVPSEAGNGLSSSVVYSVALALAGGDPNSGTSQFFINLGDNGFLDDQGFTTFGLVVSGRDIVDAIVAMPRTESTILSGELSLPEEDVIIERMSRVEP